MAGQALALVPAGIGGAGESQELHGLAHPAAAGGSEWNHGLSREIGALQKGLDDAGRLIPPDGKAHKHRIVIRQPRGLRHGRAALGVVHLHAAAAFGVVPVQIGCSVGRLGTNFEEKTGLPLRNPL